jgi:hypothetical protein
MVAALDIPSRRRAELATLTATVPLPPAAPQVACTEPLRERAVGRGAVAAARMRRV